MIENLFAKKLLLYLGLIFICFLIIFLSKLNKIYLSFSSCDFTLKGGTCISNYCEGDFGCLPRGSCDLDEKTGICIESPIGGCHEEHGPISTRHCTFKIGSTLICEEGDIEVLVRSCKDYCYWVPFVICQCRSKKTGNGWIGILHDCWYK